MITGFPSPAQGYEDNTLDLNALLIKHPASTVMMRIDTQRYSNVGIYSGDLLIVDRSLESMEYLLSSDSECIMVYENSGEFRISRKSSLQSYSLSRMNCMNNDSRTEQSDSDLIQQFHVFGIVSAIIHSTTSFV